MSEMTYLGLSFAFVSMTLIIILTLSRENLVRTGGFCPPNIISIVRVPIAWWGYGLFHSGYPWAGVCVYGFGLSLDALDGRVARAYSQKYPNSIPPNNPKQAFLYRGKSDLGALVDPTADKATVLPLFLDMAYRSYTSAEGTAAILLALLVLVDGTGGVLRFKDLSLKKAGRKDANIPATYVGKIKFCLQGGIMVIYVLGEMGFNQAQKAMVATLALTVVLAGWSIASRRVRRETVTA